MFIISADRFNLFENLAPEWRWGSITVEETTVEQLKFLQDAIGESFFVVGPKKLKQFLEEKGLEVTMMERFSVPINFKVIIAQPKDGEYRLFYVGAEVYVKVMENSNVSV